MSSKKRGHKPTVVHPLVKRVAELERENQQTSRPDQKSPKHHRGSKKFRTHGDSQKQRFFYGCGVASPAMTVNVAPQRKNQFWLNRPTKEKAQGRLVLRQFLGEPQELQFVLVKAPPMG